MRAGRSKVFAWRKRSYDGLRSGYCQSTFVDEEADDLIDTLAGLQIRKSERPLSAHSRGIRFHHAEVGTNQGSEIDLVDNEKIGTRNTRATLARYFFAGRDVDHIDRQVHELGTERGRKI